MKMENKMKIILASDNPDKVSEFKQILKDPPWQILTIRQAGFCGTIVEDGKTYLENAQIKARTVHRVTGGLVLADDSGLSVDVLEGAPGLYSARFAGEKANDQDRIEKLYEQLRPFPKERWQARFICALAAVLPDGKEVFVVEELRGFIVPQPRGHEGFGYDPVFLVPEQNCTLAELSPEEKNRISHRGKALTALSKQLLDLL